MVLAVREHQGEFIVFGSISVRPSSLRYLSGPGSVGAWGEATGTLFFNDLLTAAQGDLEGSEQKSRSRSKRVKDAVSYRPRGAWAGGINR
jgi:hypothetical protein